MSRSRGLENLHTIECLAFHGNFRVHSERLQLPQTSVPSTLYVINASSIAKPHAIEQLSAEFIAYDFDIGLVSETHLKKKHDDGCVNIEG